MVIEREQVDALLKKIAGLPPKQRAYVRVRLGGEDSQSRIAKLLGVSRPRVSHIRRRVREKIAA